MKPESNQIVESFIEQLDNQIDEANQRIVDATDFISSAQALKNQLTHNPMLGSLIYEAQKLGIKCDLATTSQSKEIQEFVQAGEQGHAIGSKFGEWEKSPESFDKTAEQWKEDVTKEIEKLATPES